MAENPEATALHAGLAALSDAAHYEHQTSRIIAERIRVTTGLRDLGAHVWESRGNFVPVDARAFPGKADGLTQALLEHGIVVRPFGDVLRISVGVQAENDAVIAAMANVLGAPATN